jgi:hypothetical protein
MGTLQIDEIREDLEENSIAITTKNETYKKALQKLIDIQGVSEKDKAARDLLVDQLQELNAYIIKLINEQRELLEELYNARH